jgi:hypothetical protein
MCVEDAIPCVLKVVCELMRWLIQLNVVRAWHDQHNDAAVHLLLDGASKLRSLPPQLSDRPIDVVTHQGNRVVTRGFEGFPFPFPMSRVHSQFARAGFENEPIIIEILGDPLPSKNIAKKHPRCIRIVGVDQGMNRCNHFIGGLLWSLVYASNDQDHR